LQQNQNKKGENMPDVIDQQVIDFIATWCDAPVGSVDLKTTLSSLGVTTEDCSQLIMDLEDHFGLTYVPGDENGITTVQDSSNLIHKKLSGGGGSGSV